MYRSSVSLLLAGAALAAAPLAAQSPLRVGQTVSGRLEAGDPTMGDEQHYDAYLLQGSPGAHVVVRMESDDFDTELHVGPARGEWSVLDSNDDSGSGTNSYLLVTLDADGRALIRAAALSGGEEGEYELFTREWRSPATTPIAVGQQLSGTLDEDDFTDVNGPEDRYTLRGTAGRTVTVSVASDAFDTQVSIGRQVQEAWEELEGNDDRGDGTNSQAVITFPETGVYQIAVFAFEAGGTGAYTVRVDEGDVAEPEDAEEVDFSGQGREGGEPTVQALAGPGTVSGTLSDGDARLDDDSYYRDYTWQGRAGERLTIDLSSDDFDAILAIGTGTGDEFEEMESNDDAGEGTDARLEVTLPSAGTFTIRVNTLNGGETGTYVLNVQSRR
ncbi:MAG TPA: hypothetical protein VF665_03305 [Longimicrobium sp.]|jgi:hypothetical protein|uniref:hypothetical protein n=1 Tax=Longimicrobium sp. TaxID=2029185 RepID=UPI002ED814CE